MIEDSFCIEARGEKKKIDRRLASLRTTLNKVINKKKKTESTRLEEKELQGQITKIEKISEALSEEWKEEEESFNDWLDKARKFTNSDISRIDSTTYQQSLVYLVYKMEENINSK